MTGWLSFSPFFSLQGNIIAIKRVNRGRVELNRHCLIELKHVSIYVHLNCFFANVIVSPEK